MHSEIGISLIFVTNRARLMLFSLFNGYGHAHIYHQTDFEQCFEGLATAM